MCGSMSRFPNHLPPCSDASGTSLSASPRPGSNALSLFFPEAYMGDRRTAFSQTLSLDLRVSRGLGDGCRLTVVIRSQLSFFKQARLRLPLDCPPTSTSPTHFEVCAIAACGLLVPPIKRPSPPLPPGAAG